MLDLRTFHRNSTWLAWATRAFAARQPAGVRKFRTLETCHRPPRAGSDPSVLEGIGRTAQAAFWNDRLIKSID